MVFIIISLSYKNFNLISILIRKLSVFNSRNVGKINV